LKDTGPQTRINNLIKFESYLQPAMRKARNNIPVHCRIFLP